MELTNEQKELLIQIINASNFKGEIVEQITEIKRVLAENLNTNDAKLTNN